MDRNEDEQYSDSAFAELINEIEEELHENEAQNKGVSQSSEAATYQLASESSPVDEVIDTPELSTNQSRLDEFLKLQSGDPASLDSHFAQEHSFLEIEGKHYQNEAPNAEAEAGVEFNLDIEPEEAEDIEHDAQDELTENEAPNAEAEAGVEFDLDIEPEEAADIEHDAQDELTENEALNTEAEAGVEFDLDIEPEEAEDIEHDAQNAPSESASQEQVGIGSSGNGHYTHYQAPNGRSTHQSIPNNQYSSHLAGSNNDFAAQSGPSTFVGGGATTRPVSAKSGPGFFEAAANWLYSHASDGLAKTSNAILKSAMEINNQKLKKQSSVLDSFVGESLAKAEEQLSALQTAIANGETHDDHVDSLVEQMDVFNRAGLEPSSIKPEHFEIFETITSSIESTLEDEESGLDPEAKEKLEELAKMIRELLSTIFDKNSDSDIKMEVD
ncbi:MAG: hypothetical protein CL578_05550 [Alteromonadaceae bacterium]|uniref:hypothetical protein n=1 Tax=uncultured Paraglaciecola sp. TaxID=1765024 RepID=UPI000C683C60|nr:hypothetical protein [Alteromonadaceae bacterium]